MPSETFNIPDPAFLLSTYNEQVRTQQVAMHKWQIKFAFKVARQDVDFKKSLLRICLVANNGSGKSTFGVAPAAVWLGMRYAQGNIVITSASGKQLDNQTGRAVRHLCEQINRFHGAEIWELKYREYTNKVTGSVIQMFATDEAGKAEGWHPIVPNGIFAMIVDEAKTVNNELFQAIMRCNGMTHFIMVSSPGAPKGFFYQAATSARWDVMKVTAYECAHIKQEEIDGALEAYGEYSPWFRSAYLAEFTSVDEQVVIPYENIFKQIKNPPLHKVDKLRAGVDLAAGGDENVVSIWNGNKQIALECFRYSDTHHTIEHLCNLFAKYGLKGPEINVDDGYVGKAIISELHHKGYMVIPVRFGGKPINSTAYGNRGTELWWNFGRHLPHLLLLDDKTQCNQLSSRYYKQSDRNAKIVLESKREAKAAGHHSPDRADATVLAFAGLPLNYFEMLGTKAAQEVKLPDVLPIERIRSGEIREDEIAELVEIYRHIRSERKARELKASRDADRYGDKASSRMSEMLGDGGNEVGQITMNKYERN